MNTLVSMVLALAPVLPVHAAVPDADAISLSRHGAQLYAAADYRNAESALRKAVAILQSATSPDQEALASTLFDLAAAVRMQSRLAEAKTLYSRSIAIREALFGADSPQLARPLAGLALAQMNEGRIAEATQTAEHAARAAGDAPDNMRERAVARNTLATLLILHGETARAAAIEGTVADELRHAQATGSQEYVSTLINLASSQAALGDSREAETELREAESVALRIAGPNHPLTAAVWNNLGRVRASEGDGKGAETLYRKAIAAWRSTLGPANPDLACGLANLAALDQARKRYTEADRLYRQAIAIDEAAIGPDNLVIANYWNDLGALAQTQHHYRDAESDLSKALLMAEKIAGYDHPDTVRIAVNLAIVYNSRARYAEACALFAKAVPVKERLLGPDSTELARILRCYADSLRGIHDYVSAERAELRATRIMTHNAVSTDSKARPRRNTAASG